ncbi:MULTISPECIES: phosphomannose isomerase type II C-terminal cupin domain [unclassified Synechococcus]|jgi:mannose-6-phosphate isomerase-like protein (cupin superfamily)|uniref:phosphomannose isomerase type II C-terminal cupin domain n=1 Tax=unclassified Synechococcus TaxID=2626047 RepID=UPI00006996A6|nr:MULTISPECIES: phosphomannose isomerase type II C-terminal cupin domain [unclassified Synechococcus]EAQ75195.1 mannose-6-phosphate isomerase WbpW-like [Synechococcus sp. WH 5701]WFN57792.1 phosphomannose isomerase type II C-terminal cupin domain [Synechococcus sp. CCFWC 502]CAK6691979.1 Alginate biosynthesis protein AlgA [Synechococcus sp. CBW1107]
MAESGGEVERRSERPWGWFEILISAKGYLIKRLWLHPSSRISLQRHHHRSEHWVVVEGDGVLECEGGQLSASPGVTLTIPKRAVHRASAGEQGLMIVEVQRGDDLNDDDIERFADDYGRLG